MEGHYDVAKQSGGQSRLAANLRDKGVVAAGLAIILLVFAVWATWQGAQKEVKLLVDGNTLETKTFACDVEALLQEKDVVLGPRDQVLPALTTRLEKGQTVMVQRAVDVTLLVGGQQQQVQTAAATVQEALAEENVQLGQRDQVKPALNAPVVAGMLIQVDRIVARVVEEQVAVAPRIVRENDQNLPRGVVKVVQRGSQGLERKKWEVIYKNGEEMDKTLLASSVIQAPVDQVVKVGTMPAVSRGSVGGDLRTGRVIQVVATAYTHTGRNTSTGVRPAVGTVAVDPTVIPMGSRLYIEGYGYGRAQDTGGSIKGNRIDVFMDTRGQALQWGRRTVKVQILE